MRKILQQAAAWSATQAANQAGDALKGAVVEYIAPGLGPALAVAPALKIACKNNALAQVERDLYADNQRDQEDQEIDY